MTPSLIPPAFRIGFGYDIHPFARKRKFMLGGVRIPYDQGLHGHSDADVLLHAICDALLGSLALGDIGMHFPDTSKKYRGVSSVKLLAEVEKMVRNEGYAIVNIDATVILQAPRISPFVPRMVTTIARVLRIGPERISIKATTNEGLGYLGRGAGCAALAVACVQYQR